jgi:predicted lipoprotein with Yx(FWY)xxD motif
MKKAHVIALAALSAFALSACGMLDPNQSANDKPAAAQSGAARSGVPSGSPDAAAGTAIKVATTELGDIVTNGKGWTLYLFTKDSQNPTKSTCYNECAAKWPPYMYSESLNVTGVDKALIGKVQRNDGSWQLTINKWPVYTFTGDKAPGETKGQGVGQTWYAVTPQGKKAAGAGGGY